MSDTTKAAHPASLYAAYRREVRRLLSNSIANANRRQQHIGGSFSVKAIQREMAALRTAYKPVRLCITDRAAAEARSNG